ncbi:hypothetical protein EDC96DRAFT_536444 [Choanephora cucurbitarum]|nr:hypothetical protein EDC96DRAFT_536444 [Choanephora cucurbitarum]
MYTLVMTVSVICLAFNLLVLLSFPVPCWNHFPFSTVLTTNKPGRPCEKVVFSIYPVFQPVFQDNFPCHFS